MCGALPDCVTACAALRKSGSVYIRIWLVCGRSCACVPCGLSVHCNDYMLVTIGRPKKKRSPPVPVAVSPEATATPPTTAPIPAPPSPPSVAAKNETKVNHAIPPSPPNNKDTDIATTVEDDTKDVNMSIDNINNTSKEQVKDHSDTTTTTEPVTPSEPPVVESVKNETVEEKVPSPPPLSPPPSPPKPAEPVVPVESPKQKSPSPAPPSPPRPQVTPPPVVTTPIKEEVQETREDTMATTPQGSVKKKRGTPDGKKKAKASLQERRREQASDWIVDFCK